MFVKVYILDSHRSYDRPYSYKVPGDMHLKFGQIVEVPFGRGNSLRRAAVAEISDRPFEPDDGKAIDIAKIKEVSAVLNKEPVFKKDQLILAKEMKRRYFTSVGKALDTILPPSVSKVRKAERFATAVVDEDELREMLDEGAFNSVYRQRVCEFLLRNGTCTNSEIIESCRVSASVISGLKQKGVLKTVKIPAKRKLKEGVKLDLRRAPKKLNAEQEAAIAELLELFESCKQADKSQEALLMGVTGSGKTEVYLRCAAEVLKQGRSVLIMVPEISLTPMLLNRVEDAFGNQAAILHSKLTPAQRYEHWQSLMKDRKKIAVGARSAIFAPLSDIGLIIIDEEQEESYKADTNPAYDALKLAEIRAYMHKALLLKVSATPSTVSKYRADTGKAELITLSKPAGSAGTNNIHLIDLKRDYSQGPISAELRSALNECFERKRQAMLFLNRRGFSKALLCSDCGEPVKCLRCDVGLTVHKDFDSRELQKGALVCHYCGYMQKMPEKCKVCASDRFMASGSGTEQAEEVFKLLFPDKRVLRLDSDTIKDYEQIIKDFNDRKADCLIGTQIIAKGHDFPYVSLMGVLSADDLMVGDDYKAAERCYTLLTQSSGRAGRGDIKGDVYIQAYNTGGYPLRAVLLQEPEIFYENELEFRYKSGYPPFGNISLFRYSSHSEEDAEAEARAGREYLRRIIAANPASFAGFKLYNVHSPAIAKLRNRYRRVFIMQGNDALLMNRIAAAENERKKMKGVSLFIDSE